MLKKPGAILETDLAERGDCDRSRSDDREKTYLVNGYDIAEANSQVFADDLVHSDLTLLAEFICKDDADSNLSLLALD